MIPQIHKSSPDSMSDKNDLDPLKSEPLPTPAPSPTPTFYGLHSARASHHQHHHHHSRNIHLLPMAQLSSKLRESFGRHGLFVSEDENISEDDDSSGDAGSSSSSSSSSDESNLKTINPGFQLARQIHNQYMDLTESQRAEFIIKLLNHAGRNVIAPISNFVTPLLKRDPFAILPNEISLRILSYVDDPVTLARASQVSKLWYLMLSDDLTWKELCRKHHFRRLSAAVNVSHSGIKSRLPSVASIDNGMIGGIGGTNNNRIDTSDLTEAIYDPAATKRPVPTSYRSHFKQQYMLNTSWATGGRLAAKYVMANPGVVTSLIMEGHYIAIALDCSKIFVFREDGKMLRSLFGHVMGVWALTLRGHTLVSGGCDRDVRVWDLKTGNCTQILKGHSSTVRCLEMVDNETAISGSRDSTLMVWDVKKGECKRILEGHTSSVRCIKVVGDICVSGSYDCTAKVWRISTGELLHTLAGHYSQIYSLAFDGNRVVTGSLDAAIRVWNPYTGECLATLQGHTSLVGHLQMSGDVLVSGGSDGVIRIWNLSDYTCIERYAAHDNSVSSLCYDGGRIVSGGTDGKVRIWESSTGHIRDLSSKFEAVWCVATKDERLVVLASKDQQIHMELLSFVPPVEKYESEDDVNAKVQRSNIVSSELSHSEVTFIPNTLSHELPSHLPPPPPPSTSIIMDHYVDPKDSSSAAVHGYSSGSSSREDTAAMDLSN